MFLLYIVKYLKAKIKRYKKKKKCNNENMTTLFAFVTVFGYVFHR